MTKKLEETFNLPDIGDIAPEDQLEEIHDPSGEIAPPLDMIQKRSIIISRKNRQCITRSKRHKHK